MIIQIPEHFKDSKNTLKLPSLSFMYYFNREITKKINVQINTHMLIHVFHGSKIIQNNEKEYIISDDNFNIKV